MSLLARRVILNDSLKIYRNWLPGQMSTATKHEMDSCKQNEFTHRLFAKTEAPRLVIPVSLDPYELVKQEVKTVLEEIQKMFTGDSELAYLSRYYFCGLGKHIRPTKVILLAKTINYHLFQDSRLTNMQMETAKIAEMIHCTSLVHDDIVDLADTRRGKPSINLIFGEKKATMGGTFVIGNFGKLLGRLRDVDAIQSMSQILWDIVYGEIMQMDKINSSKDRVQDYVEDAFQHYMDRVYKKTASLMAHPCKVVCMQAGGNEELQKASYEFGRNFGMAFQLIDDTFDCKEDVEFGMATAPVLFASKKFPELFQMIRRRFKKPGDVEKALELIDKSDAIKNTRDLAVQHCWEAVSVLSVLKESVEKYALVELVRRMLNRKK